MRKGLSILAIWTTVFLTVAPITFMACDHAFAVLMR